MFSFDLSSMSDDELSRLENLVIEEKRRRERARSPAEKSSLAAAGKVGFSCPSCGGKLVKSGFRSDGVQRYRCRECRRTTCGSAETALHHSRLTLSEIEKLVTLMVLGTPDWVSSFLLGVSSNTVQYWRDRCLEAAVDWAAGNRLKDHAFMDEMLFAPVRSEDEDRRFNMGGSLEKGEYLGLFIDVHGSGFCRYYGRSVTSGDVLMALRGRIAPHTVMTHDGAFIHMHAIRVLELADERLVFSSEDYRYEAAMELLSNCCSYIRRRFTKHSGIKAEKIEAYADLFLYIWSHTRRYGTRGTVEHLMKRLAKTRKRHCYRDMFGPGSKWRGE